MKQEDLNMEVKNSNGFEKFKERWQIKIKLQLTVGDMYHCNHCNYGDCFRYVVLVITVACMKRANTELNQNDDINKHSINQRCTTGMFYIACQASVKIIFMKRKNGFYWVKTFAITWAKEPGKWTVA